MQDKYDKAIKYLTEHPDKIYKAWGDLSGPGGCLFQFVTPDGYRNGMKNPDGDLCGCLTEVRDGADAWTPALTAEIRADESIPESMSRFAIDFRDMSMADRIAALLPFAKWQRRFDTELRSPVQVEP